MACFVRGAVRVRVPPLWGTRQVAKVALRSGAERRCADSGRKGGGSASTSPGALPERASPRSPQSAAVGAPPKGARSSTPPQPRLISLANRQSLARYDYIHPTRPHPSHLTHFISSARSDRLSSSHGERKFWCLIVWRWWVWLLIEGETGVGQVAAGVGRRVRWEDNCQAGHDIPTGASY